MSYPETKPLTKQYQTVPDATSLDETPLNNTERVAESYKRKHGCALLASGILFALLLVSAFNKNSDKNSALHHLKASVPVEGSQAIALSNDVTGPIYSAACGPDLRCFYFMSNCGYLGQHDHEKCEDDMCDAISLENANLDFHDNAFHDKDHSGDVCVVGCDNTAPHGALSCAAMLSKQSLQTSKAFAGNCSPS